VRSNASREIPLVCMPVCNSNSSSIGRASHIDSYVGLASARFDMVSRAGKQEIPASFPFPLGIV